MGKKIFFAVVAVVISTTAIVGLSSFTSKTEDARGEVETTEEHTPVACQGKHCTYSVGCVYLRPMEKNGKILLQA